MMLIKKNSRFLVNNTADLAAEKNKLPFDLKVTFDKKGERLLNKIFPFQLLPVSHPVTDTKGNPMAKTELDFGNNKDNIPSLNVNYALRSGENGLFSFLWGGLEKLGHH